jgi:multimeric flavodoxin WrbA
MLEADGIILASPTCFTDVSTEMKALIDRAGYVARANDHMFRRKVGAAVVAARRAGAIHTFDTLEPFLLHWPDDCPGFLLLEHWYGAWTRGCEKR